MASAYADAGARVPATKVATPLVSFLYPPDIRSLVFLYLKLLSSTVHAAAQE